MSNIEKLNNKISKGEITSPFSDIDFFKYYNFKVDEFPMGKFYPKGTLIMVRSATVGEIEDISTVDDLNEEDTEEKVYNLLNSCVKVKYKGDVKPLSYLKDGDLLYMFFLLKELSFQKSSHLIIKTDCDCGNEAKIELKRGSFKYHDIPFEIEEYYNEKTASFLFELNNGKVFNLKLPCVGIKRSFKDYKLVNDDIGENFLNILQMLLKDTDYIDSDTIDKIINDMERSSMIGIDEFNFLNSVSNYMNFGIKKAVGKCSCGLDVSTEMAYPSFDQLLALFKLPIDSMIKNKLQISKHYNISLSEIDSMPFWKYEESIKIINELQEEENKERKKQEKQQQSSNFNPSSYMNKMSQMGNRFK